jgi:hypothetical protein
MQEGEEVRDLERIGFGVANFVDQQAVVGKVFPEHFGFGVISHRLVELAEQFGKEDIAAGVALVNGVG